MSIVNSEIPEEGVLVEEMVTIPLALFEELIRAETERDVLEATIEGSKYDADTVLKAIKKARERHAAVRCVELKCCAVDDPAEDPADDAAEDVSEDA